MGKFLGRIILFSIPAILIGAFVILFLGLAASKPQPERAEVVSRPVAVFVEEARAESVTLSVSTQGEVRPLREIELTAQVSGQIDYVNPSFVQGGFFEAGETLLAVEDDDYLLAVTRAEAQVAQREQQLIREQAEADLARQEWEEIGEGEASSLTLREPQLADAQAQLAGAEAALAEARLNLRRTRISAPFSGRVRTKMADLGQFIGAGSRVAQVFSTDLVQIRLPLTDTELSLLDMPLAFQSSDNDPGPEVMLSARVSGQERSWTGNVVRTDSSIDPQTRTLNAIVEVADPYGAAAEEAGAPLAVGLFVNASVTGLQIDQAYVLPRSALRGSDEVYVAERDGTMSIRKVDVIDSSPDRVLLSSGVESGEWVVTSPVRGAADGMSVTPLDSDGEPLIEDQSEEQAATAVSDTADTSTATQAG